jgi:hypothetical protein
VTPRYGVVRTVDVQDEQYVLVHLHSDLAAAEAEALQLQTRVLGASPHFSVITLGEPALELPDPISG